ncbi:hypothetical protein KI688_011724 [Linnemannia hyalina]|uniref:Myb-like domain-containing protein n=1 Tax=Linnemannia hyalina TaxID=64524 RepID=A0A9P7XYQ5_9FUNG|nr:hypothetical protein KI688_011724 [Linnemannia hyalina]
MAALRNSTAQLSLITNALSRLQLQQMGSSVLTRHPSHLRFITQTRHNLLKNVTGADLSKAIDRASNNSNPPGHSRFPASERTAESETGSRRPMSPRWTAEEDRDLYQLVKEGKNAKEIHSTLCSHRTVEAVVVRVRWVRRATMVLEQQARDGVQPGEIDIANSVAGNEGAPPLRTVYLQLRIADKVKRGESNRDEKAVRWPRMIKAFSRKRAWSPKEDALLKQLVERNRDTQLPKLWTKISKEDIDGSQLLRSSAACRKRWELLHASPTHSGFWAVREEERRFQRAIFEQLESKYQVAVDVLIGKPTTTKNTLGQWRADLQQLPEQDGLPILKLGSHRLELLNWTAIAEKVKTRGKLACRDHFYNVYHNAVRGKWSEEELGRLEEGLERFERDPWRVAEHVGTRSPMQVAAVISRQQRRLQRMKKSTPEAVEAKKEITGAATDKKQ